MAGDFLGSVGVKTERDDDVKIILVDGASGDAATKKLNINAVGETVSAGTNDSGIPMMVKDNGGTPAWKPLTVDSVTGGLLTKKNALAFADDTVDVSGSAVSVTAMPALTFANDTVDVSGSAISVTAMPALTFANDTVDVSGSAVSVTAMPALTFANDTVDVSGSAVTVSGTVSIAPTPTLLINDYELQAVTIATPVNYDYLVTSGKTFVGSSVCVSSSAKTFVEIGISSDGLTAFAPWRSYWMQPGNNLPVIIEAIKLLGDGTKTIRVKITNKDGGTTDVGVSIMGMEI